MEASPGTATPPTPPPDTGTGTPAPTPPNPTPPTPPPPSQGKPGEGDLSGRAKERVEEALRARKEAETRAAEFERKLKEREEADMSEKDKAERRAQEAEQRAQEAETRAMRLEREAWLRTAAVGAGFVDPEDAVAHLGSRITDLDSETKAQNAVKKLAEEKKHLVGQAGAPATGFGNLGQPPPGAAPGTVPINPETGQPDEKFQQGTELLHGLFGRR